MVTWKTIKALGSEVTISIINDSSKEVAEETIHEVEKTIQKFEGLFSRFISGNELDRLNNFGGGELTVSGEMMALLKATQKFHLETNGIFDPTIITSLEKVGYDKSFDIIKDPIIGTSFSLGTQLGLEKFNVSDIQEEFQSRKKISDLVINENNTISIPKGFKIEFGGIGKGYIVDQIVRAVKEKYKNFWISAGGDIFLSGQNEENEPWKVNVQNPLLLNEDIGIIDAQKMELAMATSGITKRKGTRGGTLWHHIIDPRNGLPVQNDILAVTVMAESVTEADVFAKTVIILGQEAGLNFIKEKNAECLIIDRNLNIIFSENMRKYYQNIKK